MGNKYGTAEWEIDYDNILTKRLEAASEPYVMGTPEWVDKYKQALNEDEKFAEVAKAWDFPMALGIGANPEYGIETELFIWLDIFQGKCRVAKLMPGEATDEAPYLMSGTYGIWQEVVRGEKEALKSVMQGKMSLRGDLGKIMKFVPAAKKLGELSGSFEAVWPDELSPDDLEKFKVEFSEIRTQLGV